MPGLEQRPPDRIAAFPAIIPMKGVGAALEDMDAIALRGLKRVNATRVFGGDPSDRRFHPVWEWPVDKRLIAMFPRGSQLAPGARLTWCLPHLLDDVAMDFPEMTMVIAHMGSRWIAGTLMCLGRKAPNVSSLTRPLHPTLHFGDIEFTAKEGNYRCLERQIPGKVLYGSDYPIGGPKEAIAGFKEPLRGGEFVAKLLEDDARGSLRI